MKIDKNRYSVLLFISFVFGVLLILLRAMTRYQLRDYKEKNYIDKTPVEWFVLAIFISIVFYVLREKIRV